MQLGQKQYPRDELFQQIVDAFRRDARTAPVFNDKHLSWKFEWAKEMVETSRTMGFCLWRVPRCPFTWRMPSVDMPFDAELEEVLCIGFGQTDIYDFHALEALQCMVERKCGGETGVTAMQRLRGPAVRMLWLPVLGMPEVGTRDSSRPACRSQTLAQAKPSAIAIRPAKMRLGNANRWPIGSSTPTASRPRCC